MEAEAGVEVVAAGAVVGEEQNLKGTQMVQSQTVVGAEAAAEGVVVVAPRRLHDHPLQGGSAMSAIAEDLALMAAVL